MNCFSLILLILLVILLVPVYYYIKEGLMSYEGHVQALCKNGHYSVYDAYADEAVCYDCGEDIAWENGVDDTNCDAVGEIPLQDFVCIQERRTKICPTCNHTETVEPSRLKPPEGRGHFVTKGGLSMDY